MTEQTPGKRAGRVMWVLAWGAGILLATRFFGDWETAQYNPNQAPVSVQGNDKRRNIKQRQGQVKRKYKCELEIERQKKRKVRE